MDRDDNQKNSLVITTHKEDLPPPTIEEIEAEWAVMSCDSDSEWG